MITNVGSIERDGFFTISAKVGNTTKNYVISDVLFIAESNGNKYMLEEVNLEELRYDGLLVATLVSELSEIEDTYIVSDIVNKYVRGYSLEDTVGKILKRLGKHIQI